MTKTLAEVSRAFAGGWADEHVTQYVGMAISNIVGTGSIRAE